MPIVKDYLPVTMRAGMLHRRADGRLLRSEINGMASFEVRDGELTMFEVSSEMLRAAAR